MISLISDIALFLGDSQNPQLSDCFCGLGGRAGQPIFSTLCVHARAHTRVLHVLLKWFDQLDHKRVSREKRWSYHPKNALAIVCPAWPFLVPLPGSGEAKPTKARLTPRSTWTKQLQTKTITQQSEEPIAIHHFDIVIVTPGRKRLENGVFGFVGVFVQFAAFVEKCFDRIQALRVFVDLGSAFLLLVKT
jgi:hypothetical protein